VICEHARGQLTAYLEGELDDAAGSAMRGHLRTCAACRDAARDEAALRDGLRALPPMDPPPSVWAGVQARLAEAEVADAARPAWRRTALRWVRQVTAVPRLGVAAVAVAAAIVVAWRWTHPADDAPAIAHAPTPITQPTPPAPPAPPPVEHDVTDELAADAASTSASYAAAADELLRVAHEARAGWTDERKQTFDHRVAALRHDVEIASEGRARHGAYRVLLRYLRNAAVRDEVALADVAPDPRGAP
jgi:hypothetical protein